MTDVPPALIEIAIESKTKGDKEKMNQALARLAAEDPSFRITVDHETGQTIIKGMSEAHLALMIDRLKREVEANIGAPQVVYRETISRKIDVNYTHKSLPGKLHEAPRPSAPANVVSISARATFTFENEPVASGSGQYARVVMILEPLPPGSGFEFVNAVVGGTVPQEYIPGVEKGVQSALKNGPLAGFPVIDLKVTLTDGAYHDVDSNVLAFEIASRSGMKEGLAKAGPKLLQPIMNVEVVTPREYMGDVIGDLNSRRGRITGQDQRGDAEVINAMVPLANLFGYARDMEALAHGRITFTMLFAHYETVPGNTLPSPDDDPPFGPAVGMRA